VETYEYNGETLAMEFPKATTGAAEQFVTRLFAQGFDYSRIYEQDTELEGILSASFGELLKREVNPVNNTFDNRQIDHIVTYRFNGIALTYYITAEGKKIFEKLDVTGNTRIPLIYDIKTGMKTADLLRKLGRPVASEKDTLYFGHMNEAGLYYEARVTTAGGRVSRIALQIAGGV
jgi:hypothetical protein